MNTIVEFPDRKVVSQEAAEWLIRLDGETPPDRHDLDALEEWLHRSPVHSTELARLARLWGRMNVLTELAVPLGKSEPAPGLESSPGVRSRWPRLAAPLTALAVVFAVVGLIIAGTYSPDPQTSDNGLYATAVGQQQGATLADGSEVILNTNSQIRVDYSDGSRDVHLLQGEALFTVARDSERPFRVYAGNGRIEAVGTAFSVRLKRDEIDVTVTEGRVTLASIRPPRHLGGDAVRTAPSAGNRQEDDVEPLGTLTAGQIAIIRSKADAVAEGSTAVLEVSPPVAASELAERLAWREGVLTFSGDSLEDVVREVSRYTTMSIEIPDPRIRTMRIGGRFPVGEMDVMFDTLEASFGLRVVRVSRNHVVLVAANE